MIKYWRALRALRARFARALRARVLMRDHAFLNRGLLSVHWRAGHFGFLLNSDQTLLDSIRG